MHGKAKDAHKGNIVDETIITYACYAHSHTETERERERKRERERERERDRDRDREIETETARERHRERERERESTDGRSTCVDTQKNHFRQSASLLKLPTATRQISLFVLLAFKTHKFPLCVCVCVCVREREKQQQNKSNKKQKKQTNR